MHFKYVLILVTHRTYSFDSNPEGSDQFQLKYVPEQIINNHYAIGVQGI